VKNSSYYADPKKTARIMDTAIFNEFDTQSFTRFTNPSVIHRDLESLNGIISGIIADEDVNIKEHQGLSDWLEKTRTYGLKQPYKAVIDVLSEAMSDDILTAEEGENIKWFCEKYTKANPYYDTLSSGVQKLHGVIKGLVIDQIVSLQELAFLDQWLEDNEYLKNSWPYDELYNLITRVAQDKHISAEEHKELLNFFNAISSTAGNEKTPLPLSAGYFQIDPQITFQEKSFCITGLSKKYKRKEIADRIELHGGFVQNNINRTLDYLVVCDEKTSCWAFTCYGRKIEEVMHHRRNGLKIVIVHEFDLFDHFID
jgi:hypothetical protein